MTAPKITLVDIQPMTKIFDTAGSVVEYKLYADDKQYLSWTTWVNDSANKPTNTQKSNAAIYSGYVLKLHCQLVKANNACGLKHKDHGAIMIGSTSTGEIVAPSDTSLVESNTYVFKNADYTTWKATPQNLPADKQIKNVSTAEVFFNFFYCGGSRDHDYTCYKY